MTYCVRLPIFSDERVAVSHVMFPVLAAKLAECEAERARLVSAAEPAPRFASLAEYDAHWHPERPAT